MPAQSRKIAAQQHHRADRRKRTACGTLVASLLGGGSWWTLYGLRLVYGMEIVTARFLLRDFTEAERPGFLAYHADPRYLAFSGPDEADPVYPQRLFQRFRDWASEQPRRNYQLAILRRQEPQPLVGCCGLRGVGCEAGTAELGIELAPAYWGRHGYAIEVGRALLELGFGDLGLQEIYGVSVNANARAARLAEWFGAEAVATRSGAAWMSARGWNETEWRITRDRWQRWEAV